MNTNKYIQRQSRMGLPPHHHKAFTLAEVLITLGIIGVVAAITIPTLNKQIQQVQQKAAFKKAYSITSQAWSQVVSENTDTYIAKGGWTCTWPDGSTQDYNLNDNRTIAIKSKMNVVKSCAASTECWPDSYETYGSLIGSGTTIGSNSPYDYSWITTDGMCWASPWKGSDEVHIMVDTNCKVAPNKIGQDIFSFMLGADGIVYFAIDDKSATGKPVSSGLICPYVTDPATINGRTVSFKSLLYN